VIEADISLCELLVKAGMPKSDSVAIVEEFSVIRDEQIAQLRANFAGMEVLFLRALEVLEARTTRADRLEVARKMRDQITAMVVSAVAPSRAAV
jgi:hypothetical protein